MAERTYPQERSVVTCEDAKRLGLARFFTGRPCRNGHIAERHTLSRNCVECRDKEKMRLAMRAYREKNPHTVKEQNDRRDREKMREWCRKNYARNREKLQAKARERRRIDYYKDPAGEVLKSARYRAANVEKVNARLRQWAKERRRSDPQFALACALRARIGKAIRSSGAPSKAGSAVKDLGCTLVEFRQHLERMFSSEMSWENYGAIWQVDHIQPLTGFDLTDRQQFLAASHFTNLRPLNTSENAKKSGKRTLLL